MTYTLCEASTGQPLPDYESLNLSPILSSNGVVQFEYPNNGHNANLLDIGVEIVPYINGIEILDCRAVISSYKGHQIDDGTPITEWQCRTLIGMLDHAVVYPENWPNNTQPPHADFNSQTAGGIMSTLLQRCQDRGTLTWIDYSSFTDTQDSDGQPWDKIISIEYDAGVDYLKVLDSLVQNRMCEARLDGHELKMYNYGSLSIDHTLSGSPLILRAGRDFTDSPRTLDASGVQTSLLVAGKDGVYAEATDPTAIAEYGRREGYASQGNMTDQEVLEAYAETQIDITKHPKMELTHGIIYEGPQPVIDFNNGDWIYSDVIGELERLRVKQWTVSVDNDGSVSGTVVLNDLIAEHLASLTQRVEGIVGGSTLTGGSTVRDLPEDQRDTIPPGQVEDVILDTEAATNQSGRIFAYIIANWSDVTVNADGTAIHDLSHYVLRYRITPQVAGLEPEWTILEVRDGTRYIFVVEPGTPVDVGVAAIDRWNNISEWSATYTILSDDDDDPPPMPSTPDAVEYLGTIRIDWNGLGSAGESMPVDFSHAEVELALEIDFSDGEIVDRLFGPSTTNVADLAYHLPYYVRLIAVDYSGNKSLPSGYASAIPRPVVRTDVDGDAIGLEHIKFTDTTNHIPDGSFESEARREELLDQTNFDCWGFQTNGTHGLWALRGNAYEQPGTFRWLYLTPWIPAVELHKMYLRFAYMSIAGTNGSSTVGVDGRRADGSQFSVYGVNVDISTNDVWQIFDVQFEFPAGIESYRIWVSVNADSNVGEWYFDRMELRDVVDTIIIDDAAITNAKIADLAVQDAKISNLSVGKLIGGTLTADIVLGSHIRAYNSDGVNTIDLDGATGSAYMTGTLQTREDGNRLTVSPDIDGGDHPGIVFSPADAGGNTAHVLAAKGYDGTTPTMELEAVSGKSATGLLSALELAYTAGFLSFGDGTDVHSFLRIDTDGFTVVSNQQVGTLQGAIYAAPTQTYIGVLHDDNRLAGMFAQFDSSTDLRCNPNSRVLSQDGTFYRPILASSFDVNSSVHNKTNVRDFQGSALDSVRNTPIWLYNFIGDEDVKPTAGPMVEDLPEWMQLHQSDDGPQVGDMVSLMSLIGLTLQSLRELDMDLDAVRSQLGISLPIRSQNSIVDRNV